SLTEIHPGVGNAESLVRSRSRRVQEQSLLGNTPILYRQVRTDGLPIRIEQKRVLECLLRKQILAQTRQEYGVENHSCGFRNCCDKNFSISTLGRFGSKKRQPVREDFSHFIESRGTNTGHRPQFREHG